MAAEMATKARGRADRHAAPHARAALASLAMVALALVSPSEAIATCPVTDAAGAPLGKAVVVDAVVSADEVRLADGRSARLLYVAAARDPLAGPRPSGATLANGRAALQALVDRTPAARFVAADVSRGGAPLIDRYGRAVGRLIVRDDTGTWIDAAEALARQGMARFSPAHAPAMTAPGRTAARLTACPLAIRAAEAEARAAGRGIFADIAFAARAATAADLVASAGAVVAVEGRVVSLGQAGRTTYVNFGDRFVRDFTAWLSDKDRAAWLKAGVDVTTWPGQWVRLSGPLGARDGGSMRLVDPSRAEMIPPPRSPEAGEAK